MDEKPSLIQKNMCLWNNFKPPPEDVINEKRHMEKTQCHAAWKMVIGGVLNLKHS